MNSSGAVMVVEVAVTSVPRKEPAPCCFTHDDCETAPSGGLHMPRGDFEVATAERFSRDSLG